MYRIVSNGEIIGYTGVPNYIKLLDNCCYGLCKAVEAQGVAFDGIPYSLDGKGLNNLPIAEVEEISDHEFFVSIKDMQQALEIMEVTV